MSDRLRVLLRQRALLQEHLSWLDREIAAASDHAPGAASHPTTAAPPSEVAATGPVIATRVVASDPPPISTPAAAEAILEEYRITPNTVQQEVRRGCFLYFAAAFVLLGLGVVVLYFAVSSR